MKALKIIGIILAVVVLLFVGIGFALPQNVGVQRDVVIDAPAEKVFNHINSFEKFNEWSPWAEKDPNTTYEYTGPKTGVGAKMVWKSDHDEVGNGSQEIVESKPNEFVKNKLDFGQGGTTFATFKLEDQGEKTKVTWGFETDMGSNPIGRWMGLMMDSWVGGDYEKGLGNLKKLAES